MQYFILSVLLAAGFAYCLWYWLAYEERYKGDFSKVKSPLLIFDFDGTLCPSYYLFIATINSLSDKYGLKKIADHEVETLREMSAKKLMKKLGVSTFRLPFLVRKIQKNVQQQLLELEPVKGTIEILKELKAKGVSLGILTSNSEENVGLYLQKHQINCFDFIYSGNSIFGKDGHLKKILKKTGLNSKYVAYVGDEARDMEAARKANVSGIAVAWGYHSLSMLKKSNPTLICNVPNELLQLSAQCLKS